MGAGISKVMLLKVMSKKSDPFAHHFRLMPEKQARYVRGSFNLAYDYLKRYVSR
jgi:hypothetical protein